MEFEEGARIFTSTGEEIGRLSRIVIDPRTNEVTHLVLREGQFGTEDRVLPAGWVTSANKKRIELQEAEIDSADLPLFEEEHYVVTNERDLASSERRWGIPGLFWNPPVNSGLAGTAPTGETAHRYDAFTSQPYTQEISQNIPEGTVAFKEGARVVTADGEHVGSVERVIMDPAGRRATHFLVSRGLFLKERKLVTTNWVNVLGEDEVHLAIRSELLDRLPSYQDE